MIKPFLNEDFLLENETAGILYHDFAKTQPIIDYHCHLSPSDIAQNRKFENLTRIWLEGDHYKWRAMRAFGIHERYITGNAPDGEKFEKWAETVPFTIRNPLFHWTHLELKRYFEIEKLLNPGTAKEIYQHSNHLLQTDEYSTRNLLLNMNVELVCTTDDPIDDLHFHDKIKEDGFDIKVIPAFRPDKAIFIESDGYLQYLEKLGEVCDIEIASFSDLLTALESRMDFFHQKGCRLSDHGLNEIYAESFTDKEANNVLRMKLNSEEITVQQARIFMSAILYYLSVFYYKKGWTQQFHLGALRSTNTRMLEEVGADTGFDSIGDLNQANGLYRFFDKLEKSKQLTKTILYNLNPRDNEVVATMTGNYNDGSVKGKMQFGSGWWFLDQKDGMEKQMNALSNMGLLSCFVGMFTDSRSFMSFPRHEYFRRILCNLIGKDVHNGELPSDIEWLGGIVKDVCYKNAKGYFAF